MTDYSGSGDLRRRGGSSDGGRSSRNQNDEEPPNSRLFVLCGKNVGEEELREAFEKFGAIREVWVVKDRNSGESKGVAYIKFGKTSEAALAMEEMNGKFVGGGARALKVLIASNKEQGSKRDANEEERLNRLFVIIPKTMTEKELREHFGQFGDVEYCNVVRSRNSKESKGYAYVKFQKISHAAVAFESCDRSFKAVFADPPRPRPSADDRYASAYQASSGPVPLDSLFQPHQQHAYQHSQSHHDSDNPGRQTLNIVAHGSVNQDQLWKLCDFFPGLDYCNARYDPKSGQCFATALYSNSQAAQYAKDKLHGFEYPPGYRLIVKFEAASLEQGHHSGNAVLRSPGTLPSGYPAQRSNMNRERERGSPAVLGSGTPRPPSAAANHPDLAALAETIAHATSLVQAAGLSSSLHPQPQSKTVEGGTYDPSYCSVRLPPPQPLAPVDSSVKERLFIVCNTTPPPIYALKDAFGRFGNLIDIFFLSGKNCGYAKYAKKGSAEDAKDALHGQEVHGVRLKVFLAEPIEQRDANRMNSAASASHSNPSDSDSIDQKCKRPKLAYDVEDGA